MPSHTLRLRYWRWVLGVYLALLALGVFTPRPDLEIAGGSHTLGGHDSGLPKLGENILYLDGPLAWVGNVLMLMPYIFFLRQGFPGMKSRSLLVVAVATSTAIELIQLTIPGRVCDFRDILVNSAGASIALYLVDLQNKKATDDKRHR